ANLRHRIGSKIEQDVDLARHKVLHGRPESSVRHESELGAGDLLEVDGAYVRGAADACGTGSCLVWVGFQPGDQLLDIRGGKAFAYGNDLRIERDQRHGIKILH